MKRPRLSTAPHTLRTTRPDGTERPPFHGTERECRAHAAYVCFYNTRSISRTAASRHADAIPADGTPYTAEGYTFRLTRNPRS